MDGLTEAIASDPLVRDLLAPEAAVVAPSAVLKGIFQVPNLDSVTQADIDSDRVLPHVASAFDALTGSDTDGTLVAIATVRLHDTGDERIEDAERRIHELAVGSAAGQQHLVRGGG